MSMLSRTMSATIPTKRTASHDDTMITLRHTKLVDPAELSRFPKNEAVINTTGGWWMDVHSGEEDGPWCRSIPT